MTRKVSNSQAQHKSLVDSQLGWSSYLCIDVSTNPWLWQDFGPQAGEWLGSLESPCGSSFFFNKFFFFWQPNHWESSRPPCLEDNLKHSFSVFKQHYTHFHTLFHPHIFQKTTNNITQTLLPNGTHSLSFLSSKWNP